jgi:hypothetical protein
MELIKDRGIPISWEGGEMSAALNSNLAVEYSACVRVGTGWRRPWYTRDYDGLVAWLNVNVSVWQECSTKNGAETLFYLHSARRAHLMAIMFSDLVQQVYTKDLKGTWT